MPCLYYLHPPALLAFYPPPLRPGGGATGALPSQARQLVCLALLALHVIALRVALVRAKGWQIKGTICKTPRYLEQPYWLFPLLSERPSRNCDPLEAGLIPLHHPLLLWSILSLANHGSAAYREKLGSHGRSLTDRCFPTASRYCSYRSALNRALHSHLLGSLVFDTSSLFQIIVLVSQVHGVVLSGYKISSR